MKLACKRRQICAALVVGATRLVALARRSSGRALFLSTIGFLLLIFATEELAFGAYRVKLAAAYTSIVYRPITERRTTESKRTFLWTKNHSCVELLSFEIF